MDFTLEALLESNNLLQDTLSRYRQSNALLRKVNSLLRQRLATSHNQDENFKQDCQNAPLAETYWGDPGGAIHRTSGDQTVIAVVTDACTNEEFLALASITTNVESAAGGLPAMTPSGPVGLEQ
jgi:hypothetical protein